LAEIDLSHPDWRGGIFYDCQNDIISDGYGYAYIIYVDADQNSVLRVEDGYLGLYSIFTGELLQKFVVEKVFDTFYDFETGEEWWDYRTLHTNALAYYISAAFNKPDKDTLIIKYDLNYEVTDFKVSGEFIYRY